MLILKFLFHHARKDWNIKNFDKPLSYQLYINIYQNNNDWLNKTAPNKNVQTF